MIKENEFSAVTSGQWCASLSAAFVGREFAHPQFAFASDCGAGRAMIEPAWRAESGASAFDGGSRNAKLNGLVSAGGTGRPNPIGVLGMPDVACTLLAGSRRKALRLVFHLVKAPYV